MNRKPKPAPETIVGNWGIFGGMFDPVHRGHLTLADDLRTAEHLAGVLLVPGIKPPHRAQSPHASFEHRCTMLELAFADRDYCVIDRIEADMDKPAYTLNVVRALKAAHAGVRFTFLIGADQLEQFSTWYKPEELLREITIVAGARPGYFHNSAQSAKYNIRFTETRPVDVSSTRVRQSVREGWSALQLSALVPDAVAKYIIENRLYQ